MAKLQIESDIAKGDGTKPKQPERDEVSKKDRDSVSAASSLTFEEEIREQMTGSPFKQTTP